MLKLDISPCPEEPKYTLTPELLRVDPYPDESGRPTKEILEFPSNKVYVPYSVYRLVISFFPRLIFSNEEDDDWHCILSKNCGHPGNPTQAHKIQSKLDATVCL